MSKNSHRFTATLNRPQGARVFKGTADGCRGLGDALHVVTHILHENLAFEDDVTSLKITISPARKSKP
jgi:hypothetical protein